MGVKLFNAPFTLNALATTPYRDASVYEPATLYPVRAIPLHAVAPDANVAFGCAA